MSYSPAPWRVDGDEIFDADGDHVVWELSSSEDDARLIASAPDLLRACEMALNDRMYKDWPTVADFLIAAIGKARGR